jgi:hypothetical protein
VDGLQSIEVIMPVLSRDAIKQVNDAKLETIDVPEWGGSVCIKTLSGTERDAFEEGYSEQKMRNFRARFLVLTLCDEAGERLYADNEADELGSKSLTACSTPRGHSMRSATRMSMHWETV